MIVRDGRVFWSRGGVRPIDDECVVDVPGACLEPGAYTLHLLSDERRVTRYALRV